MSWLTRNGTAEPVSRDQILRRECGQGKNHFPCSADHEQDWQPYPADPYSSYMCNHTYISIHSMRYVRGNGGSLRMDALAPQLCDLTLDTTFTSNVVCVSYVASVYPLPRVERPCLEQPSDDNNRQVTTAAQRVKTTVKQVTT